MGVTYLFLELVSFPLVAFYFRKRPIMGRAVFFSNLRSDAVADFCSTTADVLKALRRRLWDLTLLAFGRSAERNSLTRKRSKRRL